MLSFLVFLGLSFLGVLAFSFLGFLPLLLHLLAVFLHSQANPLVCIHRVCLQKNTARLAMKTEVSVVAFFQLVDEVLGLSVPYNSAEKLASARLPFPRCLEFFHILVDAMMVVGRDFLLLVTAVVAAVVAAVIAVVAAVAVAAAAAAVVAFCLWHGGGVWMKRVC